MDSPNSPNRMRVAPGRSASRRSVRTLFVADVDVVVPRAADAGATVIRPVADQFYGDRNGSVRHPFGHVWHVTTHIEDVSPDEIARRIAALDNGQMPRGQDS